MAGEKKRVRRARGSGSIFFHEAKKRWVGRKVVGRTAAGKPVLKEVWAAKQADVVRKLAAVGPPGPETTVAAWAARWLKTLTVRPATLANYTEALDHHILPAMGHFRVADVKPSRIEALAAALARPTEDRRALHVNTIGRVLAAARVMFAAALREELADKNPVAIARRPRTVRAKLTPFTPAELRQIIEAAGDFSAGPLIALLAATGCRLGEASALDVADWDEAAGTVAITKTYSKRFGVGPPKSVHSRRTITVPAVVRPLLVGAAGTRVNVPLFVTGNDKRVIKSMVQRAFKRLLARLNLTVRNVHQLRHSVATALISAGVPLGDVAKYLGDSVATVVRTYVHPSGANPGAELDRILSPAAPEKAGEAVKWA